MKDQASQWDSPLDPDTPEPVGFFNALTEADENVAALAELRARINGEAATPEWKPIASAMTALIERYYAESASADQDAAIVNLAGLLRHASAFAAALCREVEHYAAEARDAKAEVAALRDQLADES